MLKCRNTDVITKAMGSRFFTVVTHNRVGIFDEVKAVDLLRECFKAVIPEYPFTIDAIAVLPDHIHCIWSLPANDFDFSTRWKNIK
jgi:putative transposase